MLAPSVDQFTAFKLWYGTTGTAKDDDLKRLLGSAMEACEAHTGRHLTPEVVCTDGWEGEGSDLYIPSWAPVTSVTLLTIDGEAVPASGGITENGWFLAGNILWLRGDEFTFGAWCELTYKAGYSEMPQDLLQSIFEYAAGLFEMQNHIAVKSKTLGQENTSFADTPLTASVKGVWDSYRRVKL